MDNKKIDIMENIKNMLQKNDRSKLVNCNGDNFFNKEKIKTSKSFNLDDFGLKISNLSDETISNMLDQRKNDTSSFKDQLIAEQKKRKKHHHKMATDWKYYIQEAIKTGLESPIPYKVIPYKNGIGIKKIEFFKPIKNNSL